MLGTFIMNNSNSIDINRQISKICSQYQSERISGQWYIEQTGLNKVSKLLGGEYKALTKKQRTELRSDCVNCSLDHIDVRSWWYYLNCA